MAVIQTVNRRSQERAERSAFLQKIDSLVHQASKLAALTSQGVNNGEFNSQLAAVHAEYDLLKVKWREKDWPDGGSKFALAVGSWDTVLIFWNIDIKQRSTHFSNDPRLVEFYMSMDQKLRALDFDSDGGATVNLKLAVRAFMSDASEYFDQAKDSIQRSK